MRTFTAASVALIVVAAPLVLGEASALGRAYERAPCGYWPPSAGAVEYGGDPGQGGRGR